MLSLFASLRSMFESSQFKENFSLFQQLLADGVFETSSYSSSGSKLEDTKTVAKLALSDPNKSHLLESYYMLKVFQHILFSKTSSFFSFGFCSLKSLLQKQRKGTEDSVTTTSRVSNPNLLNNNSLVTIERPCESLNQNFSGKSRFLNHLSP